MKGYRNVVCAIGVAATLLHASCDGQKPAAAAAPAQANESGPKIILPDGFSVHVEIASDDATREQGLMYRDHLADDHGMIFVFVQDGLYPFWMKNTLIPLDMIWLDANKNVVFVASNVPPCKADPCPNFGPGTTPAHFVLETASGVAAKHGVAIGKPLRFDGFQNVIVK